MQYVVTFCVSTNADSVTDGASEWQLEWEQEWDEADADVDADADYVSDGAAEPITFEQRGSNDMGFSIEASMH